MTKQFDFDGVITQGYLPGEGDYVCTGRCFEEAKIVYGYLRNHDLHNIPVYFNPISLENRGNHTEEARICSAKHKANVLMNFHRNKVFIEGIFEDDPLQIQTMTDILTESDLATIAGRIIHIKSEDGVY